MNKKEACDLLGVDMKGLAAIVGIKYDSLRSLKVFAPIHLDLIEWELDKRFIKNLLRQIDRSDYTARLHLEKVASVRKKLGKEGSEIERANDSGLDN